MFRLNKSQRNELFNLVEKAGFDTRRFSWKMPPPSLLASIINDIKRITSEDTNVAPNPDPTLYFLNGRTAPYSFTFRKIPNNQLNVWSTPHVIINGGIEESWNCGNWDSMLECFRQWLQTLKVEVDEPDLWTHPPKQDVLTRLPEDFTNADKFTAPEFEDLSEQLHRIKRHIIETNNLSGARASEVNKAIDYLLEKARTSGKVDWKNRFVGVIFNIIVGLGLANGKEIFEFSSQALSHFFQFLLH